MFSCVAESCPRVSFLLDVFPRIKNCSAGMKKKKNLLCSSSFSFPVLCRNISDLN